jgi:hypothetical protein
MPIKRCQKVDVLKNLNGTVFCTYLRQDQAVEDAREIALTFALWAGPQLAELMNHDVARINGYLDSRIH